MKPHFFSSPRPMHLLLRCGLPLTAWASCLAGALSFPAAAGESSAQNPLNAVWIERPTWAQGYLRATHPPKALIVTVFEEGKTAYATDIDLFKPARPQWNADQLRKLSEQCRAKGIALYGALDLLHWVPIGKSSETDVLATHPEWMEVNIRRTCTDREEGRFASPWNPEVQKLLRSLMTEVGSRLNMLDGLVLTWRLTPGELLGYSEPARAAFIEAASLDPIDLLPETTDPNERLYTEEWFRWRKQSMTNLFNELVTTYRNAAKEHTPAGGAPTPKQIWAVGLENVYRLGPRRSAAAGQDWLEWVLTGAIDGLLLECDLTKSNSFAGTLSLIERTGSKLPVMPLLHGPTVKDLFKGETQKKLRAANINQVAFRLTPNQPATSPAETGKPSAAGAVRK